MFVCKSITLANYLINNNCNIVKIDKDKTNKNFLVFIFKKDDLLNSSLSNWKTTLKFRNKGYDRNE